MGRHFTRVPPHFDVHLRDVLMTEEVELLDFFASSADVVGIRPR